MLEQIGFDSLNYSPEIIQCNVSFFALFLLISGCLVRFLFMAQTKICERYDIHRHWGTGVGLAVFIVVDVMLRKKNPTPKA